MFKQIVLSQRRKAHFQRLSFHKLIIIAALLVINTTVNAGAPPPMLQAHFLGGRNDETSGFPLFNTTASYWSNPGNWRQGVLPISGPNTEVLFAEFFDSGILTDIQFPSTLDQNWTLKAMLIDVFPHSGYDDAFFNSRNGARLTLHQGIEIANLRNNTQFDIPLVLGSDIDILTSNLNEPGNTLSGQQYFFNFTDPINTNGNQLSLRSNASEIRVSDSITGSGSLRVFGANGSRVSLRANNTYTGQTIVNSGELHIDLAGRLADASDLVVNNSGRAIFSINSADAINGLKGNGLGDARVGISGGSTLVIGNYDGFGAIGEGSFSGQIFGAGNLTKRGSSGEQSLSGLIRLTGNIFAEEGVLRLLSGANVVGANDLIVGPDGELDAQSNLNFSRTIVDGAATFSGNNTFTSMRIANGNGVTNARLTQNGGSIQTAQAIFGFNGQGEFVQKSGTNNFTSLQLALETGSEGNYQLESGSLQTNDSIVGYFGDSNFDHFGGDHNVTGTLSLAESAGSNGQYSLEAGTLTSNITEISSDANNPSAARGNSTFVNDGGTHTTTDLLLGNGEFGNNESGEGYYEINAGVGNAVTNAENIEIYGTGILAINGGTLNAGEIDHVYGGQLSFQGGTLAFDKLFGDLVNQGGTLSPGNSPGLTNITNDYIQGSSASLLIELAGITPETEYDVVEVGGIATLDGILDVVLFGGYSPSGGETFDILTAASIVGIFSTVNLPTIQGILWELQTLVDEIGSTDVLRLTASAQPVPLPASAWLFLSAFGFLTLVRKKD